MPAVHYARGEYHRIRGDYLAALDEIDEALKQTAPGQNQNWAFIAAGYLQTLLALGRDKETEAEARKFLKAAKKENLGYVEAYLLMPLAIAQVKMGDYENAVETAETAINVFTALGTKGLSLGLAYETRARVAILMGDRRNNTTVLWLGQLPECDSVMVPEADLVETIQDLCGRLGLEFYGP
ncbi:MAG: hypothetical protein JXA30_21270 [Deltaproteobacteria bacterium]|nr:hypothetical protein [Deltaproteobacteria bacterium]